MWFEGKMEKMWRRMMRKRRRRWMRWRQMMDVQIANDKHDYPPQSFTTKV